MENKKLFGLLFAGYLLIIIIVLGFYLHNTRDRTEYCTNDSCQEEEHINYNTTKLEHYQGIELITLQYDQNTTDWLFDEVKKINKDYLINLKQIIFINETVIEYTQRSPYTIGGYYDSLEDHIVVYNNGGTPNMDVEKTLCHEIAHNLIGRTSKELVIHSMVHFLGQEKFCYKEAINVERGF